MGALLFVCRLILGGVFLLAGVTKLLDPGGSRRAMAGFGAPERLAAPLAVALPLFELVVGGSMILQASAWYGALGGLALLLLFAAGIAVSLARGRKPDCHCFGQLHSEPIGWKTLARNVVLMVLAIPVVATGPNQAGADLFAWLLSLSEGERAAVFLGFFGLGILGWQTALLDRLTRQHAQLLERLSAPVASAPSPGMPAAVPGTPTIPATAGLPPGSEAPPFRLSGLDGEPTTLDALRALGKPVVLAFSEPDCGPCTMLLPEIGRWQREHADAFTLALVSRGTAAANVAKSNEHGVTRVLLQRDREVAADYGVIGTPSALLIHVDGRIGSLLAQGEGEIRRLVAMLVPSSQPAGPQPGATAPDFALQDLDAARVSLEQFRGKETLVLFWNPACGHCQRMLDDLKAWEARPLADRAQLMVISTGTIEANRALNLRSTVVVDSNFDVARRYGVQGTPSGVLVDAEGRLASTVAVGAAPILALARYDASNVGATDSIPFLATLPQGTRPVRLNCVHDELLPDGSMVLYNGCRRQVMTLNATAALAWEYCDGETDVEAIVAEVRSVFPETPDVDRDVRDLLDRLLHAGMIGPSGGAEARAPIVATP